MAIQHRFIEELNLLEGSQSFCGQVLEPKNRILVIGTFNPDDDSCLSPNDATWFYGRKRNLFWQYFPNSIIQQSLHCSLNFTVDDWRQFCLKNKIVIVDLIKGIDHDQPLLDFKDSHLDARINQNRSNVTIFDFYQAFKGIKFERVIYSRKGWNPNTEPDILKLITIKNSVNNVLLQNSIVDHADNIKYCPAPWQRRTTTEVQWFNAINW